MGGMVYTLKRVVSVTVDKRKLEEIADMLGIRRKADRDSIINDGILIAPSPAADANSPQSGSATSTAASVQRKTASRAKRPRRK